MPRPLSARQWKTFFAWILAYEVELIDKRNGTRIEAHVHPATGELLLGYDD